MSLSLKDRIINISKSYDIKKPIRYLGGEINSIIKNDSKFKFALSFPDLYEIGITNLGVSILYEAVNALDFASCERVYAVERDFEDILRKNNIPLYTLETFTPLNKCDVLGFSLQYELLYTNILQILELGHIPILSKDRGETHPIVIAGGPSVYNPLALNNFIDLFFIGEADNEIAPIMTTIYEMKKSAESRENIIKHLAGFDFIYSPKYKKNKVSRIFALNIDDTPYPKKTIIPTVEGVQNRISIEIARGCTHNCRFCLAGISYRPVRNRSAKKIISIIEENVKNSGPLNINLASLSADDYPAIKELISYLIIMGKNEGFSLSLPSLRIDSFDLETAKQIAEFKKTGLTFALEVGSTDLRKKINKTMDEDAIFNIVADLKSIGWNTIKIYFMIGFTDEPEKEVDDIIATLKKIATIAGKRIKINAAINTFVPKAHTPLEDIKQLSDDEAMGLINKCRDAFKGTNVFIKFHPPRMSVIEGLFSRADEKISEVVYLAYKKGARLDAWNEHFNYNIWTDALKELDINIDDYLSPSSERIKAWKFIDTNVSEKFLQKEKERFENANFTDDCSTSDCQACGIDFNQYCKKDTEETFKVPSITQIEKKSDIFTCKDKLFIHYKTNALASLFGMHDIKRLITTALKISKVDIAMSQGFHPLPKIVFNDPTPFGCESEIEYCEVSLSNYTDDINYIKNNMNNLLSNIGIEIKSIERIAPVVKKLKSLPKNIVYRFETSDDDEAYKLLNDKLKFSDAVKRAGNYLIAKDNNSILITMYKEDKESIRVRDIKEYLSMLKIDITRMIKVRLTSS